MSDIDSVRVAVRIRPLVKSEIDRGCQCIIDKVQDEPQVIFKNNDSFTFNYVYAPNFTQEFVYEDSVKSMIQKLFQGYNVTILAYGQTGSGKTHTMGTAFDGNFGSETGVIPRAMYDIFKQIDDMNDHEFSVTCSFMELYQEQLYDLLSTAPRDQSIIDIREDGNKGIVMPGLTETKVTTAKETTDCLIKGSMGRAVGATAMNAQSSRSHAIFTIAIQMMKIGNTNSSTNSKFHLVDLAGSERSKKTKATGDRFKEGVKINQGLLALGNVISALGSSQNNGYVGYRDSKLTRLLQDSLGGNSYTLMIACVSPADYNMDETLSTLRYADRARKIKNKPVVNQDAKSAEINRLNDIIQKLRLELLSKGGCGGGGGGETVAVPTQEMEMMRKVIDILTEKNRCLTTQLNAMLHDVADIEMRAVVAETTNEELFGKLLTVNKMVSDLYEHFNEESCSNDVLKQAKQFTEIRNAMADITGVIEKNKSEMMQQQQSLSKSGSIHRLSSIDDMVPTEAMQKKSEDFTQQQLLNNEKLRALNAELVLKEALHRQIFDKLAEMPTLEERIKKFESEIQELETQKEVLLSQLKSSKGNVSAKLAEERRIKLQSLEKQINQMRLQNQHQAKLLKEHEKDVEKIKNLAAQIRSDKSDKVTLIRKMRAESEKFRQWKLSREKELCKLKEKDRKRQNELVRMESMHSKKENVLKSKVANALAANKRLKEALEKHKSAQSHRKNVATGKIEHLVSWIDQELEVIMSVVDAEHSIEHLMEDRAALTSRLQELKESNSDDAKDISTVEEEIQMRNAQISDLQQRVVSSNIESKIKAIVEGVQSMPEARAGLKHLFNAMIELRKEYAAKDKIEDLKNMCEMAESKIIGLENEIKEKENKYKEEMYWIERGYEEKITLLLRELNNCPRNFGEMVEKTESQKIQEENLNKLEELRAELEDWKRRCEELKEKSFKKPKNKNMDRVKVELSQSWLESETDDIYADDSDEDPDWRRTPLKPKHVSENHSRGSKRGSDGTVRCSCKGKCATKQCTCRKNSNHCSENCKCTENCKNKATEGNTSAEMNDINSTMSIESLSNQTIVLHKVTPTKSMLSTESIIEDVGLPYPFAKRSRKPLSSEN